MSFTEYRIRPRDRYPEDEYQQGKENGHEQQD